jgi:N-acetylglucosamine-6-phosphate deacetylase
MTDQLLITHARIAAHNDLIDDGWLLCSDSRIAALGAGTLPEADAVLADAAGALLMPGFIDIHVHGGAGHEVMDAAPETLPALSAFYAAHGVTGFLATTWTDTPERTLRALTSVSDYHHELPGARLLGVHLEGPFLNQERCGAQNPDYIRRATPEEALPYLDLGIIRLLALAPEYAENHWLIDECVRRGIRVSAAHTSATFAEMVAAVQRGVRQTTHTFNAMSPLHHREPGVVGAALALDTLDCEIIADNVHVHPGAVRALFNAKGMDRTLLITDAVRPAGLPDGDYPIDERVIHVRQGVARLTDGTLAGSVLTMERGLVNFAAAVSMPAEQLWRVTSLNPARAIGLETRTGSISEGKDADLVLLGQDGDVVMTIVQGKLVFDARLTHVSP